MSNVQEKIDPPQKPKPCSVIPHLPPITIPTPFGIDLASVADPSKGPPTDCTLAHSLILQLTPMLAGFTCVLKILGVVAAIKNALSATPPLLGGLGDLAKAIEKASDCLGLVNPVPWIGMIKGILQLILAYITCLIQGFESIRNMKVGIDLNAEGGTPVLLNTLDCAKNNADTSLASLMSAMAPITPLMQLIDLITGIVGIQIGALPQLSLGTGPDPLAPVIQFRDSLAEIVDSLPG
jgi:hypothetical protein